MFCFVLSVCFYFHFQSKFLCFCSQRTSLFVWAHTSSLVWDNWKIWASSWEVRQTLFQSKFRLSETCPQHIQRVYCKRMTCHFTTEDGKIYIDDTNRPVSNFEQIPIEDDGVSLSIRSLSIGDGHSVAMMYDPISKIEDLYGLLVT